MRFSFVCLASSLLLNSVYSNSISLENESKIVKLSFNKTYGDSFNTSSQSNKPLFKRSNDYEEVQLTNEQSFYSVELDIGTPVQSVVVLIDTGSSDLWITGSNNPLCGSSSSDDETIDCSTYGTFDINSSSTYHSNDTSFEITYGDGSYASGGWGQDVIALSDVNVTGVSFAVANYTNSTVGVLGIGLPSLETTFSGSSTNAPYQYANLPIVLRESDLISKTAYSLYLDNADAAHGSILFGAVDHSKYYGNLNTIPIVNVYRDQGYLEPIEFDVTLQGMGISTTDEDITITQSQIRVLLDSGTTISYMPTDLVSLIAQSIGATYSPALNFYVTRCLPENDETELVFDFGGFHITAPLRDFLIPTSTSYSQCMFAMVPQSYGTFILGDVFLTHVYAVYDLESYEISLAQADYSNDDENIEVISSTVPGATRAASYSNTWSRTESIVAGGNIFTLDSNSTTSTATNINSSGSTRSRSSGTTRSSSTPSDSRSTNDQNILGLPTALLTVSALILTLLL